MSSPSHAIRQLRLRIETLQDLIHGLEGHPKAWSDAAYRARKQVLADMGIILVSKTAAAKKGYTMKRTARPVVKVDLLAPIAGRREFYILDVHFNG
jgi:hypothetical protein